ncbi:MULTISPECIES: YagK/YfjJ domain-containing protein [Shewanella]|uniref:Inovirus Gp2 family protein n=1 Tax=Shewanella marisflavi TaxID=260364 RepID=A0ABX5WSV3_9GAMM|nr:MULTISPECIES: inovirus-type Gp2 protein [Shewanella]QDF76231.1 inovirus Gp2 family protein [Shewanella marisflavi]
MYVSDSPVIDCLGATWSVNAKPSGIYPSMAKRFISQFLIMLSHYNRVHVLRFDLHQRDYNPNNKRITVFNRRLFKRLKKRYSIKKLGYCWVREQELAQAQHYHYALFMDGRIVQYPHKVLEMVNQVWEDMAGTCFTPKNCFYNVCRDDFEQIQAVVYRISYFAKAVGKGCRPPQTKDYSTSRIELKVA